MDDVHAKILDPFIPLAKALHALDLRPDDTRMTLGQLHDRR
jgi:hypothetical protein